MAWGEVIQRLSVVLGLDTAAFSAGASEAEKRLARTQRKLQDIGKKMTGIGTKMSIGITAPLAAFGVTAFRTAADFQSAMNQVSAVSGATGDELAQLRQQARDLGATTQFSASEAADAMNFLAMAGMRTNDILGAMPGTLQLAASAQLDMARSADIVTNILAGYNMGVEDLARTNDVLVKAFTSANTDLTQLAEAMKYAGPVASAAGVEFEQAAAAIAMMGNAGIQGTMAGTSLRGAISRVLSPTAKMTGIMQRAGLSFTDAAGRLLPLDQIIQQMEPHAEDAGMFMDLFGQRAGPAMAALVSQGSDALRDLTGELQNSAGTAEHIANVQMQGAAGAMRELKSVWEELQLAVADSGFIDAITGMARVLTRFVGVLGNTNPAVLKVVVAVGALAAALGPVLIVMGMMVSSIGTLLPVLMALGSALAVVRVAMLAMLTNPVILGAAALIGGIYLAWRNWDKITAIVSRTYNAVKTWIGDKLTAVLDAVMVPIRKVEQGFGWLYDRVVGNSWVPDMVEAIGSEMGRLDAVMVSPALSATERAEQAFRDMAANVRMTLARLFPDIEAQMRYDLERSQLGQMLSGDALERARRRLANERDMAQRQGRGAVDFAGRGGPIGDIDRGLRRFEDFTDTLVNKSKVASVRVVKSFKDMADETLGALNRMASAIQGGGFLGILEGLIGLGLQLGSIGAFGKGIAGNINRIPAYATGTNFHPGGLALVGERGPELVSMPRGSRVTPNDKLGGVSRVEVIPSPYFDVVVDGRVQAAAPAIASAGAQGGVRRMGYMQSRRVP